jgi:hypothetical protein
MALWILFFTDLMVGAALLLSTKPTLQMVGLVMVLAAASTMMGLTLWFYVQNRREASG